MLEEEFHTGLTCAYFCHGTQREHHPAVQLSRSHRCEGAVNDAEQGTTAFAHGTDELKIACGEFVDAHKTAFFDACEPRDVFDVIVKRQFEIGKHGTGRHCGSVQMVNTEAFQILHCEMFQQLFACIFGKSPVFQFVNKIFVAEEREEAILSAAFHKHFFGGKTAEQFVDILGYTFGHQKFARGNIEERKTEFAFTEMNGGQKVVFTTHQHVVGECNARRNEFGNAALH